MNIWVLWEGLNAGVAACRGLTIFQNFAGGIILPYHLRFLCRHCYQLPYASQNEGRISRVIEQKHKLGERIFEHYDHGEGWSKKKGVHWKTFNRLHARYEAMEQQWCRYMGQYLHLL